MGNHKTAAVILVTDPGGSGTFYDLAVVVKGDERWANIGLVTLGDRVKVHAIAIKNNLIVLDMTTHGPGDTMSFPTEQTTQSFVLQGGRLIRAPNNNLATAGQIVIGPVWKWAQTLYNNDTKAVPQDPERYTLQFGQNETVGIQADCNRGGGTYEVNGSQISIQITHTTRAACPSGSLEGQFIKDLNAAVIYFTRGGALYIDLKYDTGTMKFNR
jgi:heat shock protein HslJ